MRGGYDNLERLCKANSSSQLCPLLEGCSPIQGILANLKQLEPLKVSETFLHASPGLRSKSQHTLRAEKMPTDSPCHSFGPHSLLRFTYFQGRVWICVRIGVAVGQKQGSASAKSYFSHFYSCQICNNNNGFAGQHHLLPVIEFAASNYNRDEL